MIKSRRPSLADLFFRSLAFVSIFSILVYKLGSFPPNGDEATYIYWAWILKGGGQFMGYIDASMPLYFYLLSYALRLFDDPLFAGRIISVISAIVGSIGIYFLVNRIAGKKAAAFSALFYLFAPFTLFHHKIAFRESLLLATGIYIMLFSYLLFFETNNRRPLYIMALAISLAAGIFTKQHALLFFAFPIIGFFAGEGKNKLTKLLAAYSAAASLIILVAIPQYNGLIVMKNFTFKLVANVAESEPIAIKVKTNISYLIETISVYIGIIFLLLVLLYLIRNRKNTFQRLLILYSFVLIAIFIFLPTSNFTQTRYLLNLMLPWFVFSGIIILDFNQFIISKLKVSNRNLKNIIFIIIITIIIYPSVEFIYKYHFMTEKTPFTNIDKRVYVTHEGSGFYLFDAFKYLEKLSENKRILVVTELGSGPKNWPLILFANKPNIQVAQWPGFRTTALSPYLNEPAYAVLDDFIDGGGHMYFKQANPDAKIIKRFWRPEGKTYIDIVLVEPSSGK